MVPEESGNTGDRQNEEIRCIYTKRRERERMEREWREREREM